MVLEITKAQIKVPGRIDVTIRTSFLGKPKVPLVIIAHEIFFLNNE